MDLPTQEKKRLEDAIAELRLQSPAAPAYGFEPQQPGSPLSPESRAVIQELESPRAVNQLRSELSDVRLELQRLTEEVRGDAVSRNIYFGKILRLLLHLLFLGTWRLPAC